MASIRVLARNWPSTIRALGKVGALPRNAALFATTRVAIAELAALRFPLNPRDPEGNTPLHLRLADGGNPEVIETLLRYGADPNCVNNDGKPPIIYGIERRGLNRRVVELLARSGGLASKDTRGRSALHIAAEYLDPSALRTLIELGIDPNEADREGWTPMHALARAYSGGASNKLYLSCVEALLAGGARIDPKGPKGTTPLLELASNEMAMSEGKQLLFRLVLLGADIEARDGLGRSVLHLVRPEWDSPEHAGAIVSDLIDLGADPGAVDADGRTVIHRIVLDGGFHNFYDSQVAAVRALLTRVCPDTRDHLGRSPLQDAVALYGPNSRVARLLCSGRSPRPCCLGARQLAKRFDNLSNALFGTGQCADDHKGLANCGTSGCRFHDHPCDKGRFQPTCIDIQPYDWKFITCICCSKAKICIEWGFTTGMTDCSKTHCKPHAIRIDHTGKHCNVEPK